MQNEWKMDMEAGKIRVYVGRMSNSVLLEQYFLNGAPPTPSLHHQGTFDNI